MKDKRLSRLKWHCRRSMRELDVILEGYLECEYRDSPPAHQAAFESLLNLQDPDILALLTGRVVADDDGVRHVVQRILTNSRDQTGGRSSS
jgi:antitoxin CptB